LSEVLGFVGVCGVAADGGVDGEPINAAELGERFVGLGSAVRRG
jgi:hypothetical protein